MNHVKKGDEVVIRSGKDAGKRGTVQRVLGAFRSARRLCTGPR